jgi:GNAT superfamily N-acetyltransferase
MTITFEQAQPDHEPVVRELQAEAVGWLAERGTDQWQPAAMIERRKTRPDDRNLHDEIKRGEVFLVKDDDRVIGTLTLDDYADPEFWTEDDKPKSALYVHRMIVSRDASGHNVGAAMLDWASKQAARSGRTYLRLDAWRTNTALHDYYRRHGFVYVRTISLPWRGSGALFERAVQPLDDQADDGQPRRTAE